MNRRTHIMATLLLSVFAGACATVTQAPNTPTISLDRAIHFTAPNGNDIELSSGIYRVEQTVESQLRLLHEDGQPIEIQATQIPHEEAVASPTAMVVMEEGQDDTLHL